MIEPKSQPHPARLVALTAGAMLAFAGNSLLCRLALADGLIDAASFTSVRVGSGAAMLAVLSMLRWRSESIAGRRASTVAPDWRSALMLFIYMGCFSFAYLTLGAGTGALILFGAVQLTMLGAAYRGGERLRRTALAGLAMAVLGLIYLVAPGVTAPSPLGAGLMATAGVAWGCYSLLGRGVADPLGATASNFMWSAPLAIGLNLLFIGHAEITAAGFALAAASGIAASGLGYTLWYAALKDLAASRAGIVQLSVPVIAAVGGVAFLSEPVTPRLVIAAIATLGGIALAMSQRVAPASAGRDCARRAVQ